MGDDGLSGPPAKKRGATRQISKDDSSESDGENFAPAETGSFKKASEDVIAGRRIVKVRRVPEAQGPPASNPFASLLLAAPLLAPEAPQPTPSAAPPGVLPFSSDSATVAAPAELSQKVDDGSAASASPSTDPESFDEVPEKKDETEGVKHVESDSKSNPEPTENESENGKGKQAVSESVEVEEDAKENIHSTEFDTCKGGDNTGRIPGEPVIANKESDVREDDNDPVGTEGMEDSKGGSDDGSKQGLGTSDFAASDKSASSTQGQAVVSDNLKPVDGVAVVKDTPSVGAATFGTFSFGTASSSSERPTAFASFSSSWGGFGSSIASGTGLGPGFAFNKVANDGTFAPDLSKFGGGNAINMDPITAGPSFQPPACAVQFQGANTPTGEEGEKMVFGADATLFEFQDGTWKERGKGELRINVPMEGTGKARMLMRSKGNFRLILNASLLPGMKMTPMDSRGVTFACANSAVEEKSGLATYALKFKDNIVTNNFRYAVDTHKNLPLDTADGTKNPSQEALKTPENSPSSVHNS